VVVSTVAVVSEVTASENVTVHDPVPEERKVEG